MGKKAIEIVQVDITKLIESLNKAFADEWLAYHQYWLGAKLAVGPMKSAVIAELIEHANDELRHADMLAQRVLQLGGKPPMSPSDWPKIANCAYASPSDPYVKTLLEQNIKGEQCAIMGYSDLLKEIKDKDIITYNMVSQILEDEVEHEDDLSSLLEDLKLSIK